MAVHRPQPEHHLPRPPGRQPVGGVEQAAGEQPRLQQLIVQAGADQSGEGLKGNFSKEAGSHGQFSSLFLDVDVSQSMNERHTAAPPAPSG